MNSYNLSYLLAQSTCHNTLARLFSKPVSGIHDNRKLYENLVKASGLLRPKVLELAKRLRKTVHNLSIEDLQSEYKRLFEGENDAMAYPCSNLYNDDQKADDGLIEWINGFYTRAGYKTDLLNQPSDHISTELDFIHHLLTKVCVEFRNDNIQSMNQFSSLRCQFIHEHMIKWVPEFTRKILCNSKSPYYLQLAILVRTILITCNDEDEENQNFN